MRAAEQGHKNIVLALINDNANVNDKNIVSMYNYDENDVIFIIVYS